MHEVHAEREAEITLHIKSVEEMEPCVFPAGHMNYARYIYYYRRTLEMIPEDLLQHILDGEHTMHHTPGIFNGEWSDMAIETTAMKDKASDDTIICDTNNPDTADIYMLIASMTVLALVGTYRECRAQTTHRDEMVSP